MLRSRLEAGDIYVSDSLRFRSFYEDLIPRPQWQQHKERILRDADVPALAQPMAQMLQELETELEACEPLRAYTFLDIGDWIDLHESVNLLEAARGGCAAAPD